MARRLALTACLFVAHAACSYADVGVSMTGGSRGAVSVAEAPSDGDFTHVITYSTGSYSSSSVVTDINAKSAGSVLVRSVTGDTATITGDMTIPRTNITFYDLNLDGEWAFANGTTLWGVTADPFKIDGEQSDDVTIRDSLLSGGAGAYDPGDCVDNVYNQNWLAGTGGDGIDNWLIENNTFQNYQPRLSVGCSVADHTEALFIGSWADKVTVRNNLFHNQGTTAHIFLTHFGGSCSEGDQTCEPNNICIEGNTFTKTTNQTVKERDNGGFYFDSGQNIRVDEPGDSITVQAAFVGACVAW